MRKLLPGVAIAIGAAAPFTTAQDANGGWSCRKQREFLSNEVKSAGG